MQATDRNALVFNDMELVQQNRDKCNELPIEELHLPGEANKMHTPEDETCCFVRLATSVINDMIATSAQQPDEVLRWIFGFKATPALTSYSTFLAQNDNGTGLEIVAMCNITEIISLESNDTLQNSIALRMAPRQYCTQWRKQMKQGGKKGQCFQWTISGLVKLPEPLVIEGFQRFLFRTYTASCVDQSSVQYVS